MPQRPVIRQCAVLDLRIQRWSGQHQVLSRQLHGRQLRLELVGLLL
jgi:hypothetical protein